MKIFRNSPIEGSPPDTLQGFGYVWESATGARKEIRWPWPSAYLRRTKTEGYRITDGKVYGHTTFQMESDGQQYVSSLYLSTPDTSDIKVLDLGGGDEFMTSDRPRITFGDTIISVVQRNRTYTVCDYSGEQPAYRVGDATAWANSSVLSQGDTMAMLDDEGRTRLFGLYQVVQEELRLFVSSPLDGSPLTVAEIVVTDPPVGEFTEDTASLLTAGAVTAMWLKKTVPELAHAKVLPFIYVAKVPDLGVLLQSMGSAGFFVYPSGGGASIQAAEYNFGTGETSVHLYTVDDSGTVTNRDLLQAALGSSMFVGSTVNYPEFDTIAPGLPPFWRGFIKSFETI